MEKITKTAMITVCGRPNVGKSSLTNALVGEKIAIVSDKPQTTRNRIYGVVNRGDTQYVLLDTPGFHKARNRLGDYMVKVTRESIADVDAVLLLVEPVAHVGIPEAELIEKIKASSSMLLSLINYILEMARIERTGEGADRPHPGGKDPLHPVHQQDRHCREKGRPARRHRGLQRGVCV